MNSPASGFRKGTTVTWGLVALSAAGAVGASALAYSATAKSPSDSTESAPTTNGVFENTWSTPPTTTTTAPPGFNGAPLGPAYGSHTRSRGS